jgi:hypothetical protein
VLEEDVLPRPAVSRVLSEKFIEARMHTDHPSKGDSFVALERGYIGYQAQATYLIIDPKTRKMLRTTAFTLDFKSDEQLFVHFLLGEPPYDQPVETSQSGNSGQSGPSGK